MFYHETLTDDYVNNHLTSVGQKRTNAARKPHRSIQMWYEQCIHKCTLIATWMKLWKWRPTTSSQQHVLDATYTWCDPH